jgi:hypothetical protein
MPFVVDCNALLFAALVELLERNIAWMSDPAAPFERCSALLSITRILECNISQLLLPARSADEVTDCFPEDLRNRLSLVLDRAIATASTTATTSTGDVVAMQAACHSAVTQLFMTSIDLFFSDPGHRLTTLMELLKESEACSEGEACYRQKKKNQKHKTTK